MRRMLFALTACALAAGAATAQDPTVQPAQPALPKAVQPVQPKPAQPILPMQPRPVAITAARMAQLEEDFELVEAQREVKKAHVKAAEVVAEITKVSYDTASKIHNNQTTKEVLSAKLEYEMAKAQFDIRVAELKETEVKLKHAKKRLDDAKLGGVRPVPPIIRPQPVDPAPQVRFVADEKEVAELKAKIAKAEAALKANTEELKKGEKLLADAKAELAKRIDIASKGRVTPDFLEKARAAVNEATDAVTKTKKERDVLEAEAAALAKKLKEIEK